METATLRNATADQVFEILGRTVTPLQTVDVPTRESNGRVLADDIASALDYPPFDRAVMDGFAVRSADFAGGAARLRCLGLAAAGAASAQIVAPGACLQINTGGPVPSGADAVVIVENAQRESADWVYLTDNPCPGQHIEKRGGIVRRGGTVVRRGTRIRAGTVAALVSAGAAAVCCYPAPRVALLCTGDELVDAGDQLADAQIYDSNSAVLEILIRESGGSLESIARAGDTRSHLIATLRNLLNCDLLVITGGMSKGSHDLVPAALEELGVSWLVTSLDLKPGKPTRIGCMPGGAWVLGLPGNPVSCAVCFLLFGRALLQGLQGQMVQAPPLLKGILNQGLPANGARPMYHPATWHDEKDGQLCISPVPWRGSGDPFGLASATALLVRERSAPVAEPGEQAWFMPLELPNSRLKA